MKTESDLSWIAYIYCLELLGRSKGIIITQYFLISLWTN